MALSIGPNITGPTAHTITTLPYAAAADNIWYSSVCTSNKLDSQKLENPRKSTPNTPIELLTSLLM